MLYNLQYAHDKERTDCVYKQYVYLANTDCETLINILQQL